MPTKAKSKSEPGCLTYVGDGQYILGVPTDEIHDVEPAEMERLIETGLYKAKASCKHESAEPSQSDESGATKGDDS